MNILREAGSHLRWASHRLRNRVQNRDLRSVPDSYRVVAFIPVFNEADIIESMLARLAQSGVEAFVVDNWSTDGTWDLVRRNSAGNLIEAQRFPGAGPPADYDLRGMGTQISALCLRIRADWCLWIDADEYFQSPWPSVSLRTALYRVDQEGFNAVGFQRANFHPVDNSFEAGGDFVLHFRYWTADQSPLPWNRAWKKTAQTVRFPEGSHDPRFAGRHLYPCKFILRHYPVRSQAHGERKIFGERRPRYSPEGRSRGWHIQYDRFNRGDSFLQDPAKLHALQEETFLAEMKRHQKTRCPICSPR